MKEGIQANFYLNTHLESSYEIVTPLSYSVVSLIAQLVKNPPAMQDSMVQSLGRGDPLEKGKATHSRILAWRIPDCIVHGVTKSD